MPSDSAVYGFEVMTCQYVKEWCLNYQQILTMAPKWVVGQDNCTSKPDTVKVELNMSGAMELWFRTENVSEYQTYYPIFDILLNQ